jgi:hypothetical protein
MIDADSVPALRKASLLAPRGGSDQANRAEEVARADFMTALDRKDVEAARRIVRRYVGIEARAERLDLEARLWESCAAYTFMLPTIDDRVAARRETRIAFDHSGSAVALQSLHAWAKTRRVSQRLAEAGAGEMSCESVIVAHASSFEPVLVARTRRWLVEHHVPLPPGGRRCATSST